MLISYNRIKEIFEQRLESCGNREISVVNDIELKNISFSYAVPQDDSNPQSNGTANQVVTKDVVTNLNAKFTKGNIYAITGANGAGKSTLINLIMGMYIDEYEGTIAYNGIDIRDIDMVTVRKNLIGFAEQEPALINDSIRYNLCTIVNKVDTIW